MIAIRSALAGCLLIGSLAEGEAQTVRPRTTLSVTTSSRIETGKLVRVDSARIYLEKAPWRIVEISRADILEIERRGRFLGGERFIGPIVGGWGALFVGGLVAGYCQSGFDCGRDTFEASIVGGGIGLVVGSAVGAVIGSIPSWKPVPRNFTMSSTPCDRGRVELQAGRPESQAGSRFGIGIACVGRVLAGFEIGMTGLRETNATTELTDATYGRVVRWDNRISWLEYYGTFAELPLVAGIFDLSVVSSLGLYRLKDQAQSNWSSNTSNAAFYTKYPAQSRIDERTAPGLGLGLKASIDLGEHLSIGGAVRLHQAGLEKRRLESGIVAAYRP